MNDLYAKLNIRELLFYSTAIFVFILIISGNYLGELLPCRVQHFIRHNMIFRHFFGFLTLVFFVVLTLPKLFNQDILLISILLYAYFIILSKTYYVFWIIIVSIFGFIFVTTAYLENKSDKKESKGEEDTKGKAKEESVYIKYIRYVAGITIMISTVLGFLIYLGNKKREYGKNFHYMDFLLGKPECSDTPVPIKSYWNEILYAFK